MTKKEAAPMILPVLYLRGLVLFPKMMLHFDVGRKKSILALNAAMQNNQSIFLAPQVDIKEEDPNAEGLAPMGVVGTIKQILKQPGDGIRILVEGNYRAKITDVLQDHPYMMCDVVACEEAPARNTAKTVALARAVKEAFSEYMEMAPKMAPDIVLEVQTTDDPGYLADYITANIMMEYQDKMDILCELHPVKRLQKLLRVLAREVDILKLETELSVKVREQIDQNQREYFMREQIKAITEELGETDSPQNDAEEFKEKILSLDLPDNVREKLLKECDRLYKMPFGSHEANVVRNYLDICMELPWNVESKLNIDINRARKILDADHYGMDKVKERMLELLAVKKLAPDVKGQIICLVGPPGVGKTSIAKSVARAIGCKYVRIALGGVRDESDIRGHRRTYIGAMPGRIISAVNQAGTKNPLLLLDEIDKLGADYKGDPTSALLEVLDAEQNNTFQDHYIDLPFDLSDVLFITTANDAGMIPGPLLDRMDIIELPSYTHEEKFQIAKRHLIPKQMKKHGLTSKTVKITDDAIHEIISGYTREAGVRNLERTIASLYRKAAKKLVAGEEKKVTIGVKQLEPMLGAKRFKEEQGGKKDEIGLVNGLAWTAVGGETMPIEVAVMEGNGKIELTGNLGDVMKESAKTAISCVRTRAKGLNINPDFYKTKDIHIHVPEGAVPKDGPSAGIAMATAVVSALSETPARHEVAMTGEITLRGRVLPIGGLKEKTMAAYRYGIKTVIIPAENQPDLKEVDEVVKSNIQFVPVETLDTVLEWALAPKKEEEALPAEGQPVEAAVPPLAKKSARKNAFLS